MGTELHNLRPPKGSKRGRKRIGRGESSGWGKTAGRGHKGQRARSGARRGAMGFEGGQMPLQRRLPKRGFTNLFKKDIQIVNVGALARLGDLTEVTPELLLQRGLISRIGDGVKVLAAGEVDQPRTIQAHAFSAAARVKIEAAGGKAAVVSLKGRGTAN